MEIKLKGREIPRNANGDAHFEVNIDSQYDPLANVMKVFSPEEVVELVNRALYQLEYQRESHRKRGQAERDRHKALKEALKAAGKDVKVEEVNKQLKGE
jgi:hypothetical protein